MAQSYLLPQAIKLINIHNELCSQNQGNINYDYELYELIYTLLSNMDYSTCNHSKLFEEYYEIKAGDDSYTFLDYLTIFLPRSCFSSFREMFELNDTKTDLLQNAFWDSRVAGIPPIKVNKGLEFIFNREKIFNNLLRLQIIQPKGV